MPGILHGVQPAQLGGPPILAQQQELPPDAGGGTSVPLPDYFPLSKPLLITLMVQGAFKAAPFAMAPFRVIAAPGTVATRVSKIYKVTYQTFTKTVGQY